MVVSQGMLGYGLTSVVGAIPAEIFQGRHYGSIFGTLMLASIAGGAVGPWLTGVLYDRTGSYTLAFWIAIGSAWSPRWRSGSPPRARCARWPAAFPSPGGADEVSCAVYLNPRLWAFTRGVRLRIAGTTLAGLLAVLAGTARLALLGWVLGRVLAGDSLARARWPVAGVARPHRAPRPARVRRARWWRITPRRGCSAACAGASTSRSPRWAPPTSPRREPATSSSRSSRACSSSRSTSASSCRSSSCPG